MNKGNNIIVLDKIQDLYKNLGNIPADLDGKSEFYIHDLGTLSIPIPFVSPIYRADFFSLVFVKNAKGTSFSEHYTFNIEPNTVYFNNPGDIKHVEFSELQELYLVMMSESFLKENVHHDIYEEFPFLLAETIPPSILDEQKYKEFEIIYKQILFEFGSDSSYRFNLIGHLIAIILIKLKQYFWNNYNPIDEGTRSSQIVKKFRLMLEKHYRNLSQGLAERAFRINEYAEAQNLHPNYFSTIIKSKTGKPVGTWITEKTISEAKALLRNPEVSVKEIAYRLGFIEAPHFSAYFKKYTGTSPVSYRKENSTSAS